MDFNKLTHRLQQEGEFDAIVRELNNVRSSRLDLILANKNIIEVLIHILRSHRIDNLQLSELEEMDLSGTDLSHVKLSGAHMLRINLSGARLVGADLSNAILAQADLSDSILCISPFYEAPAKLSGAVLTGANLSGVQGFRDVNKFTNTNLKGVKGLSKEDLEYAKSKGAIID